MLHIAALPALLGFLPAGCAPALRPDTSVSEPAATVPAVAVPAAAVSHAPEGDDATQAPPAPPLPRPHHGAGLNRYEDVLKVACGVGAGPEGRAGLVEDAPFQSTFGRAISIVGPLPDRDALRTLANAMSEPAGGTGLDDARSPAGLIFLGQFIDHDVTLDAVSRLAESTDPANVRTIRTPRLDLDSVYLDGPEASAFLYDPNHHGRLLTGTDANELDLPRNRANTAIIGDPRNDENTVIAQMHLMFLRFHNAVLADVEAGVFDAHREEDEDDFEFARRLVRWHYQWIVQGEFLSSVVDAKVLAKVRMGMGEANSWCRTADVPAFPIEFSAAAYRFGHSQIRGGLRLQRGGAERPLFARTGGLSNFGPIPSDQTIDWSLFFRTTIAHPQPSRALDPLLTPELLDLPFVRDPVAIERGDADLAFRNLQRGSLTFQLPTGEQAHGFLKARGLTTRPDPVATHPAVTEAQLDGTPLWFYCLHEASAFDGRLGDVGGTLVAATLLRMLTHDPLSFLADETTEELIQYRLTESALEVVQSRTAGGPTKPEPAEAVARRRSAWKPFLGPAPDDFTMADLVRYTEASEGVR
ncbi:MAG: peroxidase family protein [Planctomycetota bacterium]